MLTICNKDSQTRNAIRCGITAKVRRKNEYARENRKMNMQEKTNNFFQI